MPLPKDFVEKAERIMSDPAAEWTRKITTSKIRRLFSLFTDIYNVENRRTEPALTEENVGRLRLAQIRMLYEAGRDRNVKDFLDSAGLVSHLKAVGTTATLLSAISTTWRPWWPTTNTLAAGRGNLLCTVNF